MRSASAAHTPSRAPSDAGTSRPEAPEAGPSSPEAGSSYPPEAKPEAGLSDSEAVFLF